MVYNQRPQKFWGNTVIAMDNSVASLYYSSVVGNGISRIMMSYPVKCFPHNLHIALYSTYSKHVVLKLIKKTRTSFKK